MFDREIKYDHLTRDYAMYLDGNLVGFAPTYHDAEIMLNDHVAKLLASGITETATALDGGDPEAVNWSIHDVPDEPPPDDAPGEDVDGVPQALAFTGWLGRVDAILDADGAGFEAQDVAHGDWRFDWQESFLAGCQPYEAIEDALVELRDRHLLPLTPHMATWGS